MRMNKEYIGCHNHTEFSNFKLTDSITKVKDLLDYINTLGNKGVAITDHNILSAHIEAINHVIARKKDGIYPKEFKLILGNEIYLVDEEDMNNRIINKERVKFYHFILLAKDEVGHRQIRELSTIAWERAFSHRGLVRTPNFYSDFEKVVSKDRGHLIASTACLGGMLATSILETQEDSEAYDRVYDFLDWCIDMFGEEDIYLEMQPSIVKYDEHGNEIFNEQKFVNEKIVKIGEAYGIKTIITTDSHYLKKEDAKIHAAFLNSDEDGSSHREVASFYETTYVHSVEEFYNEMDYLGEETIDKCIDNTIGIWNKITEDTTYGLFHKPQIPLTPVPNKWEWYKFDNNIIENYKNMKELWVNGSVQEQYLISQLFRGIEERNIKQEDMKETLDRIEEECTTIVGYNKNNNTHVGAYFTTMQEFINKVWEVSIVGAGRGSAVSFIINYLLGISQINPLKAEIPLYSWRFITPDVKDMPDIDFDSASHLKEKTFEHCKEYFESANMSFIRVATYSTLKSKSAIKTACKGLGINNDISNFIASLIVTKRGIDQNIIQSYYGDDEKGIEVNTEFKNVIDKYSELNLLEVILKLEGLKVNVSSHASGVLPLNGKVTDTNSVMRTPNGELITVWDLHESEQCGNLKYDMLLVTALTPIQNCLTKLVEDGFIEWQGSLRETYNKYLHPDVIDINNKETWSSVSSGKVLNLFQFNTGVGEVCIKKIKPISLAEMSAANSLMRLMAEGEQPIDKYVRFKNNPQDWEDEMDEYGLTKEEKKVMHELVDLEGGVMCTQETMMISCMKLCGFTTGEANSMRRVISKKKIKDIPKWKEIYMQKGLEKRRSENILNYNWEKQISLQLGYGFASPHTYSYSMIGYQEAYLYSKFPSIYWNYSILQSEAGALETEEEVVKKEKTINYGKIASAIDKLQKNGTKIELPDINKSQLGFSPDVENNVIHYGLKGITTINSEVANTIIENRPYKSFDNFIDRLVNTKREITLSTGKKQLKSYVSTSQAIQLIKAGAFNSLDTRNKRVLLEDYLKTLYPDKAKLTVKDVPTLIELGIIDREQFEKEIRIFNFREYITSLTKIKDEESKTIKWINLSEAEEDEDYVTQCFFEFFNEVEENIGYKYSEEGSLMIALGSKKKGSFDKAYDEAMKTVKQYINKQECIDKYNSYRFNENTKDIMYGTIGDWELESVSFRENEAGIDMINEEKYNISNYFALVEEPEVVGYTKFKDNKYPKYKLEKIAGQVLDKNNVHHTVSILTKYGVVNVKYNKGNYAFYNKQISFVDEEGKKVVLEKSIFEKGTKIFIVGYRRDDNFIAKTYKGCGFENSTMRVIDIDTEDGSIKLRLERTKLED